MDYVAVAFSDEDLAKKKGNSLLGDKVTKCAPPTPLNQMPYKYK